MGLLDKGKVQGELFQASGINNSEFRASIVSAIEAGVREYHPDRAAERSPPVDGTARNNGRTSQATRFEASGAGGTSRATPRLISKRASEIRLAPIEWLWPGRIAIGKLTLIGGDPGLGKSQIATFVAARITTGSPWPCNEGRAIVGNVVIFSAEDGVADTIVPRLVSAGADRERVEIVSGVVDSSGRRTFDLKADIALLESKVRDLGNVKLIIIDPISAYLGKVDGNDNVKTRNVLEPIAEMADRLRIGVLGLTHLNKGGSATGQRALLRFIGSIATIAAARAGFVVVEDREVEGRILFLHAKNNIAPPQPGMAYRILQRIIGDEDAKPAVVAAYIDWELNHVTQSADAALSAPQQLSEGEPSAKDEAAEFLQDLLAGGEMPVKEVEREAVAASLHESGKPIGQSKPFRDARKALGVKTRKAGFGKKGWVWVLPTPPKVPSDPKDALQK
jgi:hypothetical protein